MGEHGVCERCVVEGVGERGVCVRCVVEGAGVWVSVECVRSVWWRGVGVGERGVCVRCVVEGCRCAGCV